MDAVWGGIITALISGFCVAVPTIVTTITSNKAHDKVMDERMLHMSEQMKDISIRLEKLQDFNDRLIIVEQSVKAAHKRLDDQQKKGELKNG